MERQLGDDVVMDSLLDIGIIATVFGVLTAFLSALGVYFMKESSEKEKDMLAFDSVLREIFSEIRYRETIPAVVEIVEFFREVQNIRKDIKLEEIICEPQNLNEISLRIEEVRRGKKKEMDENDIQSITKIIEYFDKVRREKRRLKLMEIAHDDSYAEEIDNRLRKLKDGFQEEEKTKREYRELVDCCSITGWLLISAALFSFFGIFLVGVAPEYLSISPVFFWTAEISLLAVLSILAIKKYLRSRELKKIFLDHKMEYMKPKPYHYRIQGGK